MLEQSSLWMWLPFGHRDPSQCFLLLSHADSQLSASVWISLNSDRQACSVKHASHFMDEESEAQSLINSPWANSW